MSDPLDTYLAALEALRPHNIETLIPLLSVDIRFRDPFNDCIGHAAFLAVMRDMFDKLDDVRFSVEHRSWTADFSVAERTALARWTLSAQLRTFGGENWRIEGCSELYFDSAGLVIAHYDYWDAAAGLYERIPLLGRALAAIRKRIAAV